MIHYYKDDQVYHQDREYAKEIEALEQQLQIFLSKDVYTYQHSKRVFSYAAEMSDRLNLSSEERRTLILGALIHDIGKLEIPRDIINKKGKLDPHEWDLMKKHVIYGKEIISSIKKYDELLPLIELHHERYDGKGYPYGLKETNIPKLARILCIIDSFDAMTTERPYQKTKTFAEGIRELRACSGYQFDPTYVEPFIQMIEENHMGQGDRHTVPPDGN
ncbi:HD-GYP domain-containing protein [Rossellomorea sp. AcN35-11]|nr:HD-GYP domain-containing protein [Rossellomorea sp. AcN35-11]